jgi:hypothetical protein
MDNVYSELQNKAFLRIGSIDNSKEILEEILSNPIELVPYIVKIQDKEFSPLDLKVASLIDTDINPDSGAKGYGIHQQGHWIKENILETTLGKSCPITINTLYDLFGRSWIRRVKISKLSPNSQMLFHRHPYLLKPGCNNELVIHIPLQTNSNVNAMVSKIDDETTAKKEHFKQGEIWYLNTYYYHKFENKGDTDRYHLWINLVYLDNDFGINEKTKNQIIENLHNGISL